MFRQTSSASIAAAGKVRQPGAFVVWAKCRPIKEGVVMRILLITTILSGALSGCSIYEIDVDERSNRASVAQS